MAGESKPDVFGKVIGALKVPLPLRAVSRRARYVTG